MTRAHDHACEPRGIEKPLFLVEVPASGLLRHQSSLKAVGEPGNDILEARHLLVEIGAEAPELLLVTELIGFNDLIEAGREGLVVRLGRKVPVATARGSKNAF